MAGMPVRGELRAPALRTAGMWLLAGLATTAAPGCGERARAPEAPDTVAVRPATTTTRPMAAMPPAPRPTPTPAPTPFPARPRAAPIAKPFRDPPLPPELSEDGGLVPLPPRPPTAALAPVMRPTFDPRIANQGETR